MTESKYFAAETDYESERVRLTKLQRLFDPYTFKFLERTGINKGWRCLELGAGGGSVSRWLASQVGESGKVVSLDLSPRFLNDLDLGNIEVRQCDIRKDQVEIQHFDLAFTRLVLTHLGGDVQVIRKLINSLKPNGWLVVEDIDFGMWRASDPGHRHADEYNSGISKLLQHDRDFDVSDPYFGGRILGRFADLGMVDVDSVCRLNLEKGGSELARFWWETFAIDADALVKADYLTQEQAESWLQKMLDPDFYFYPPPVISVRGRKPSEL